MSRIDVASGLTLILNRMNDCHISYMIVGSIAGAIYGEPRLTRDIDLVVQTGNITFNAILSAFSEAEFYVPPAEIISQEIQRRGQINILHHASGLKVDCIFLKSTEHAQTEFANKVRKEILPGLFSWVARAEDIIIKKLEYYREGQSQKHLTDIRGIMANTALDSEYLSKWVSRLKLEDEWKLCQS